MDKFCIVDSILPAFCFRLLGLHWRVCRFLSVPAKRLVAVRLITVFDITDFVASTGPLMRCFFIKCVDAAIPGLIHRAQKRHRALER